MLQLSRLRSRFLGAAALRAAPSLVTGVVSLGAVLSFAGVAVANSGGAPIAISTTSAPGSAPTLAGPSQTAGASVALVVAPTEARTLPDGGRRKVLVQTYTSMTGEPQTLLVLGSATVNGVQWLDVLLPIRPDGSTGWINSNYVELSKTGYWIHVRLGARQVLVFRRGRLVERFRAVVGKKSTPTPTGLTAIYEEDPQPSANDFFGTWALVLAMFSNTLKSFDGGPGQVAIHGRGGTSLRDPLGSARSHGCVRVANRSVNWLAAHVPAGTPVLITKH